MNTVKRTMMMAITAGLLPAVALADGPSPAAGSGTTVPVGTDSAPVVVLVDPGAEPREPLRYDFSSPAAQSMQMDMNMSMSMSGVGPAPQVQTLPTMRMVMSFPTVQVTPEGNLTMTFSLDRYEVLPTAGVPPETAQALQASLGAIGTVSGWNTIDTQGRFIDGDIVVDSSSAAAQLMTSLEDSMEQMLAPFPEEAVGNGARWQTSTEVSANGLTLAQTAIFTLVSRSGNDVVLDVEIEQNAPPQDIADPSMPPGSVAHLDELRTTGSGRMNLSLSNLVPTSTLSMSTAMRMSVMSNGVATPAMAMTTNIDMTIGPLP